MIRIDKSKTADTRTCDYGKVTKEQLLESSEQHIGDVKQGMEFFAAMLVRAGYIHDHTKITEIDMFHSDFKTGFATTNWWEMHKKAERHHLSANGVPEDVNLIDVIEYIVDGVMAGMARSGKYRKEEIPEGLLEKAFNNTITLLLENLEVNKDLG